MMAMILERAGTPGRNAWVVAPSSCPIERLLVETFLPFNVIGGKGRDSPNCSHKPRAQMSVAQPNSTAAQSPFIPITCRQDPQQRSRCNHFAGTCAQAASYCDTLFGFFEFCGCSPAYTVPALPDALNGDPG